MVDCGHISMSLQAAVNRFVLWLTACGRGVIGAPVSQWVALAIRFAGQALNVAGKRHGQGGICTRGLFVFFLLFQQSNLRNTSGQHKVKGFHADD